MQNDCERFSTELLRNVFKHVQKNMTISIKQQLTESVILEGLQVQNVHHVNVYIMYIMSQHSTKFSGNYLFFHVQKMNVLHVCSRLINVYLIITDINYIFNSDLVGFITFSTVKYNYFFYFKTKDIFKG